MARSGTFRFKALRIIDVMAGSPHRCSPVVLIVEDEPLLRMLAVEVVEKAGFVTLEAGDADEAVALLKSRPDILLLFTDINMPGSMDGLKLAHVAHDGWPPVKILVVSGQSRPRQTELPADCHFIEKPYRAAAMVEELRSLAGFPGI
jgi:CheY-like chemotaxis protein